MNRYTDEQIYWWTDTLMNRYTDGLIHWWTDILIDLFTDGLIHLCTDTLTDWYTSTILQHSKAQKNTTVSLTTTATQQTFPQTPTQSLQQT